MKTELVSVITALCLLTPIVAASTLEAASALEERPIIESESAAEAGDSALGDGLLHGSGQAGLDDDDDDDDADSSNDEHSTAPDYSPWSHKPVCTDFLDELGDQLCVYTDATFSNGRGISIFTTPPIAQEFASLLPFQDPTALSSRGINLDDDVDRPWYTTPIPGKGVGMLATRALQRGDLITAYTPYLLAHMENVLSTSERERFLRIAVDQLPAASRDVYLSLAKIYGEPSVVVQDVVKANAFEMQVGGQMHLAVFPEASRMNHACGPNAQYYLSPTLLTHFVHAVRPIAQGEEVTISYAPPLRLHADRQQYLQSTFHFACTCARCTHTAARPLEDADKATEDMIALQWALSQWTANSTASVKKAEMLVALYRQEGLDAFLDDAYGHAALTYNAAGSARGAKKYAKLAAEAARLKYGPDAEAAREWDRIVKDPTVHSSWRRRKTG
ncbi:SET domain-containing protein [Cladophialophora immunda]|nr:SET domain-containing protein [Cladophialophora immunda]